MEEKDLEIKATELVPDEKENKIEVNNPDKIAIEKEYSKEKVVVNGQTRPPEDFTVDEDGVPLAVADNKEKEELDR